MSLGYHNTHFTSQGGVANRQAGLDYTPETIGRFWAKVNQAGPVHPRLGTRCWLWTASLTGQLNHGQFTTGRRPNGKQRHIYAHRFSFELVHGPIATGVFICHHCDVPACVNPAHLFPGSQQDNLDDASRKGRLHTTRTTKAFTLADRLAIYYLPYERGLHVRLAKEHGVSKPCISKIRHGHFVGSPLDLMAQTFERVAHRELAIRGEVA
jgi:hypothetical protein